MLSIDDVHAVDALDGLGQLADDSIDCVLTSPPYWAMRDYKVSPTAWSDGSTVPLGHEPVVSMYVDHLVEVCEEVRRALKPSGTFWLNIGDLYASSDRDRALRKRAGTRDGIAVSKATSPAIPKKCLSLIPGRLAVRLVEQGWIVRNTIVWHKPNFIPSPVKDRFTCSWEHLFFLVKSNRYWFNLDAVREPHQTSIPRTDVRPGKDHASKAIHGVRGPPHATEEHGMHPTGRNPGDCWLIYKKGRSPHHPAPFPEELCTRPILAGCPPGGIVLDPFAGSGTTLVVAKRLGRRYLGFDASAEYARLARVRLALVQDPLQAADGGEAASSDGGCDPCSN